MIQTWQKVLMHTVKNRKGKLAIYPFGEYGLRVKHFLNNVLGISEDLRIDRSYSQYTNYVIDIDTIMEVDNYQEYIYIITTTKHNFAHELLMRGIPEENIVFCYPDGVYANKLLAYYDALFFLIHLLEPKNIYDVNLLFGEQMGKSMYSGMECREKILEDIILYADKEQIMHLFPAQRKKYEEINNNHMDIVLFTDTYFNLESKTTMALYYKKTVVLSKMPILELTKYLNCMYSYLYVYILEGQND